MSLMRLAHLEIENYKGLRSVRMPLSSFVCLVGENNAGKSSVLQALALFRSGTQVKAERFYDDSQPLRISVRIEEISDGDLTRLAEVHRERIRAILVAHSVTLIREFRVTEKKGRFLYLRRTPKDLRFSTTEVDTLLKGKRKGAKLAAEVGNAFPELAAEVTQESTVEDARRAIEALAALVPDDAAEMKEAPLPTGFDESVAALLPEVIYIPAVKDLNDDVKTTETTPFGRILGILMGWLGDELSSDSEALEVLRRKLTRIRNDETGEVTDDRAPQLKKIEESVDSYLRESFPRVHLELEVPPPEIRTILSNAQIIADDGVRGTLDTKGDGLRRAVVFAIFRAYVELAELQAAAAREEGEENRSPDRVPRYLLLFEEPELYLHPKGQHQLFDALRLFSLQNFVVVSTHSPLFLGPRATGTFVKLAKRQPNAGDGRKPYAEAHAIDLGDMKAKDQFQLICFENNNAAFFSERVILVEGDSDYLVLPHLTRVLCPDEEMVRGAVSWARIGGKSSIGRYRKFFRSFGVDIRVIADLDVLVGEFGQLEPTPEEEALRARLLAAVDAVLPSVEPSEGVLRQVVGNGTLREAWTKAREVAGRLRGGAASADEVLAAIEECFACERYKPRVKALREPPTPAIATMKSDLIGRLETRGVFVLSQGAIEAYYPGDLSGGDKTTLAASFCDRTQSAADAKAVLGAAGAEELTRVLRGATADALPSVAAGE
jgi:hypothetical protein